MTKDPTPTASMLHWWSFSKICRYR